MKTLANILFAAMAAMAIALCAGCGEKEREVFFLSDFPINPQPVDLDTIPHQYVGRLDNVCGTISKSQMTSFGGSFVYISIADTTAYSGNSCVYSLNHVIDSNYVGKQIILSGNLYYALAYSYLNMFVYVYVLDNK